MGDRAVAGHPKRGLMLALALLASPGPVLASGECPPAGYDKAALQALKAAEFALADADAMPALAEALLPCLASRDPELRDGIAYEALAHWLRAGNFEGPRLRAMRDALYEILDAPDEAGFAGPFSALVLAEIARTDRIEPWMTPGERAAMVERAAAYVAQVRD